MVSNDNEVSLEEAIRFIDDSSRNSNSLIISGGEPTIHPHFLEIVEYAKHHFKHVSLMTNGLKFADTAFLNATIDAGIDRISIPFYSSEENEYNEWVGNINAFERFITGLSNVNDLLSNESFEIQLKLLLAKFTYRINPRSVDYIAKCFPNIKRVSLYGFHISDKAFEHANKCVLNYNESRPFNDFTILKLKEHGFDYHVCEIPLCAFSEDMIGYLLQSKKVAYTDETYLKRPDWKSKVVSSPVFVPDGCKVCSIYKLCPKILAKNASSFEFGIRPVLI